MNLSRNAAATFGVQVVSYILVFIGSVIVARATGVEGKGIYSFVVFVYSLSVVIGGLGIPTFPAYFIGRGEYTTAQLFANSVIWALLSVIWLGGLGMIIKLHGDLVGGVPWEYLAVALALAPIGMLVEGGVSIVQGLNRIRDFNLLRLANPLANTLFLTILLLGLHWPIQGALLALALSQLALLALMLLRVAPCPILPDWRLMRRSFTFGVQWWVAQLIGTLNLRSSMLLVGYYLGATGLGYFSVAQSMVELLHFIPITISAVLLPVLSTRGRAQAAEVACTGIRHTLILGGISGLGLILIGRWLIEWFYTPAFLPSVSVVWIMVPGGVAFSTAHITTTYFNGQVRRPLLNSVVASISLVLGVGLGVVATPIWGLAGAVASSTIGYLIAITVNLAIFVRYARCPISEVLIPRASDLRAYGKLLGMVRGLSRVAVGW